MENNMEQLDRDTDGSSLNIVESNVDKLKTLFPDIFSEGKIDFDKLRETLGDMLETQEERYNFTWNGKAQARRIAQTQSTGTLRPCKEESKNWDTTQNLFIEGDNLEVLKLLQKSYHKQVKMIYIDPPYNTGKEFIYPDNYKDNLDTYLQYTNQKDGEGRKFGTNPDTSGRYHTNWLNMMYPRLKLARNLLRDDGVIAIHIDEHEYSNLEKLLCEIFGEENNLGTIIWDKRNPKGDAQGVAYQHEQIVFFAKNISIFNEKCTFMRPKANAKKMLMKVGQLINSAGGVTDSVKNEYKEWLRNQDVSGGEKAYSLIDDKGDIYRPVSMAWPNKKIAPDDYFKPLIHPITGKECPIPARGWRNPSSTMKKLQDDDLILFGVDESTQPNRKYLLKENLEENVPSLLYFGGSDDSLLNQLGIFFDNPKVVDVAKRLMQPIAMNNDLVLDFFSGSCTTAHSVMDLNAHDNSKRKFIMVQLPEPCDEKSEVYKAGHQTIADIGKERIRRAGEKIMQDNADKDGIDGLDIGFKVFKLDSSNIKPWDADFDNLEDTLLNIVDNIKEDRTEDDVLTEILLKYGLDLSVPIEERQISSKAVYSIGLGALVICLDDAITLDVVEGIGHLKEELDPEIMRVVFKDSGFQDDVVKSNAIQILKKYNINDVKSL
jgi:adenine-specific DNA-methyltransferase